MKRIALSSLLVLALSGGLFAAPFAKWFRVDTSAGKVRIWGEGDEFSAVFESEDGWTLLYSQDRRGYVYADRDAQTGALKETDIALGGESGREADLAGIEKHLRDTSEAAEQARQERIAADEEACGTQSRWNALKAQTQQARAAAKTGLLMAPPSQETVGTVKGLTLLIDFPVSGSTKTLRQIEHPSVTKDNLESLINGDNCTLYGNASSVRSYYKDVSCGNLDYSNIVLGWFVAKHPRSYYDDSSEDNGPSARELIGEVLDQIAAASNYESYYLPLLKQLTHSGQTFTALNVFYAGDEPTTWGKGLWAHKWVLDSATYKKLYVTVDGVSVHFRTYQISPVTDSPSIGTFCHENGHMVCGFPDLYNYTYGNGCGLGGFSLMSRSGEKNPVCVDAYLRAAAGWVTPKTLTAGSHTVTASLSDVWKWENPDDEGQYYLIENRRQTGRDENIPGSGILILRCDESGDNTTGTYLSDFSGNARYRRSNEASVEQADGQYHIERRTSGKLHGEQQDLWYSGNSASGYGGVFSDDSVPCALWTDKSRSGLKLSGFSAAGYTMTFTVTDTTPVGTLTLGATRAAFGAGGGSGSFSVNGSGSWKVSASDSWITLYTTSGSKTGTVSYSVAANGTTSKRYGEIKVTQGTLVRSVSITQDGKTIVSGHFQLDGTTLVGWDGQGTTDIVIPDGVTKIGDKAFYIKNITSVKLPDSVTEIGACSFGICSSLTNVTFGSGLTTIGDQAFFADSELTGLLIVPSGVTKVGYCAFYDCGYAWCVLPATLTALGWGAFEYCKSLQRVYFRGNAPKCGFTHVAPQLFMATPETLEVLVPTGSTGWSSSTSTVLPDTWPDMDDDDARKIRNYSTSTPQIALTKTQDKVGCRQNVRSVEVRSTCLWTAASDVAWIRVSPAYGSNFGTVAYTVSANASAQNRTGHVTVRSGSVSVSLAVVQYGVGKEGLEHFEIVDGVLVSWDGEGPTDVVVPAGSGITAIGEDAFYNKDVTSIVLSDEVASIGRAAFDVCLGLTNVVFGSGLREIESFAFGLDHALTGTLRLPDAVKTIGYDAFWGSGYSSVSLPGGMTHLDGGVFSDCKNLVALSFRGNAPTQLGYTWRSDNTEILEDTPTELKVYVPWGSTGWSSAGSAALPSKWPVGDGDDAREIGHYSGYVIRFMPNGGTGTPCEMHVTPQSVRNLLPNIFSKSGCVFSGWTNPYGRRYDDGVLVFKLGAAGDVIPLRAVWSAK